MSSCSLASQLITQKYARSVLHKDRWLISGLASASLMGFFISTMAFLLLRFVQNVPSREKYSNRLAASPLGGGLWLGARRALLGFDQASMGAVAIGMIFGSPAAADGNGGRLIEFQNARLDIGSLMGAVAEGRVFCPGAAAIRHAPRHLFHDRRLDQIVV